jgi:hypothetical protein
MKIRTITAIVGATGLAIALPLLAAERLAADTGQWESTITIKLGSMNIPKEQLDKMTPAQRTQMEQMMKQMSAMPPQTMTEKSCVTEKDLDGNAFGKGMEEPGQKCESKLVNGTAKHQEWSLQCTTPQGTMTGRIVVDAPSRKNVKGTMEMRSPQMNADAQFESRWLAASCPTEAKK